MTNDPLVSVIMPAYNAAPFIAAAIDSVLAQTYTNLELIVVDDGSTDSTASVVQSYGRRVRYIYQSNARQAAARNCGLRQAHGELCAFIDADDIWLPDKLEKQVALYRQRPEVGLVYCSMQGIDRSGSYLREWRANLRGAVLAPILLGQIAGGGIGSTSLVPRQVFEEIGGFDPNLPPCEDTDLLWRIASRYPIDYVDEVLVLYRLHGQNDHHNVAKMERAWKLLYRKALADQLVRRLGWQFRRRCYGRLYYMLAGDHRQAQQWASACWYAICSLVWWPPTLSRIIRRIADRMARAQIYFI